MRVWNSSQGRIFGVHFSTTDWKEGGSPAFGSYAQDVLNEQIVDDSDLGLVIFTDRLGSPTPDHPSGTAEEIDRLRDGGKEVAVILNNCQRPPISGTEALEQRAALDLYLKEVRREAFVAEYDSTERLSEVAGGLLTRVATKYRREADAGLTQSTVNTGRDIASVEATPSLGVWPRVEVSDLPETDSKGRLKTKRRWSLVLESNLDQPVTDVSFRYENGNGQLEEDFDLFASRAETIAILPPKGQTRFPLLQSMGSPGSAMCVVSWTDPTGKQQTTRATVRTH
ncbi:hypothetical protein [Arthrobacter sp. B0490]|uniref:hypothetical protein n=1 Tax=Arthrobacter sp. B0490 TaxID=2058891 RepID=UPI0011B0EF9C|nr:hypothetical protein [Arthrobacter sp. B0490]